MPSMERTLWVPGMHTSPDGCPIVEWDQHHGYSIVVEFAKESRPKRDTYDADRAFRARRPPGFRLVVSGISRDTSWQVWLSLFSTW